jgi:hypothetical protein
MGNRLNVVLTGGSGNITLSPQPGASGLYEFGTVVTVTLTLDSGFSFTNWTVNGSVVGTNVVVLITIARSDVLLKGLVVGEAIPEFDYGLRLWTEHVDITNKKTRLTVEQKDYVGTTTRIISDELSLSIGNIDSSPVETFVTSSLNWNYVVTPEIPSLDFLLTNDPREFRVKYYRGYVSDVEYDHIWIGYLKTSLISRPEYRTTYKVALVATDGIKDLQGYKTLINRINLTDAMTTIASLLKQTFRDPLPIKECVRVFEDRMTAGASDSVFNQYYLNEDFAYADDIRFQREGDQITFNPTKKVFDAIESCTKSFVTRVFQWNGYWYVVRVYEYTKGVLVMNSYSPDGVYIGTETVLNDQEFPCIGNPERQGEDDYTEFNAFLSLGSINRPAERSIIADDFSWLSWINPNPGRFGTSINTGNTLKYWLYINAVEFDGVRGSEVARIEHVSSINSGEFPRFWGTANGLNDVNISGISWRSIEYNSAVKNADLLTVTLKFQCLRRGSSDRAVPLPGSHVAALQIRVGDKYLAWDGQVVFTWTTTPTKISIPIENTNVFNVMSISGVVIPGDGLVEFTLYQLVTVSGTRHRYIIDWDDISVALERNDALTYSKIEAKSITGKQFSNVFPDFEIFQGDAMTNLSSSAMILKDVVDNPVTESWSREGVVESEPLLAIVLQDLVNMFGKNNYSVSARIMERENGPLNFSKAITYKGKKCVILSADLDDRTGIWDFQFYELEE